MYLPTKPRGLFTPIMKAERGFTMIELMITVTLVAVLASVAAPSMRTYVLNNRLNSAAQEYLRTLQTARSEAVKRQATATGPLSIVVCASANPLATDSTTITCTTGTPTGWIVFEDDNVDWDRQSTEPLIEVHSFDPSKMYVVANGSKRVSYAATGFANPAGTTAATQTPTTNLVMCDSRSNVDSNGTTTGSQSVARGIFISTTGRAHITRTLSDIQSYLTDMNSGCPP